MAAYPQFGYSYPSAGQLLVGSEQLTINSAASASAQSPLTATNPPSLSPGGSGTGTQPGALSPGSVSQTSQTTGPLPNSVGADGIMTSSSTCCENGRPVMTDPVTGQVICSCQYDSARLALSSYSRLPSSGVYGTSYPSSDQNPYPTISLDSSAFYSPLSNPYALKDNGSSNEMSAWSSAGLQSSSGYYSYDPALAAYGYGAGYDLASRRKNATRESTATLKAWLNEHKKNPYPTKGEKIMLAIITKMTLTQISTWFANARRRLKKEKKMTWEPKNKTDDDDDAMLSDDEKDKDDLDEKSRDREDSMHRVKADHEKFENNSNTMDKDRKQNGIPTQQGFQHHPYYQNSSSSLDIGYSQDQQYHNLKAVIPKNPLESDCGVPVPKTKIWSLADTAACRTPPLNLQSATGTWGYPTHYQHQMQHQQSHSPHQIQNHMMTREGQPLTGNMDTNSTPSVAHHGMMNSAMFNANPTYTQYEELITRQNSTHPFINTNISNTSPISPNSSSQSTSITESTLLMHHRQSLGFPEALQTETPPQTPPNMKSPTTRSLLTTTLQILTTDTTNNNINGNFHNQQLDTPPTSQQQMNILQMHDATGIKSLYKNNNFVPPV